MKPFDYWGYDDNTRSMQEGWLLTNDDEGRVTIARLDDPSAAEMAYSEPKLQDDQEANEYVWQRALGGSEIHLRAIWLQGYRVDDELQVGPIVSALTLGLDEFTWAYIEAALWSTNDESNEQGGNPLDDNYGAEDIAPATLKAMVADCKRFQEENAADIATGDDRTGYTAVEHAGHDFWLTRNGHGCGFWDGDWPEEAGGRLTRACEAFGEINLYVSDDDGVIY